MLGVGHILYLHHGRLVLSDSGNDLYSLKITGWAMENRLTKDLVIKALKMAIGHRRPGSGLLVRSERGSQYASHEHQKLLQKQGMICSMRKQGNYYDNAVMKSFFVYLKS
ncbi:MAG TPA: DDE-type integrase/transposase/recombinase [Candidatus Limnocylindrales bacterium]|nr:DDE-type integrase/transposase/recombinase [Candidatus Limnocylindrales bacterium]